MMVQVNGRAQRAFVLGIAIAVATMAIVWFYTPAPTMAARYAWERYHAGQFALALDRTDANLAFAVGVYYFGNQSVIGTTGERPYDLPLAERAFRKATAINPSLPLAHYMRARIEFIHADFNAALADLNTELAQNPAYTRTLYMRALTYTYRNLPGDLALAEADFRVIVAWAPQAWAGYNDLAFVLAKEEKYADAVPVLKKGIATADGGATNPWLWNTLGTMQLNLHEPSAAVASFLKAQTYAAALTDADWQRAYPGNDPALAADGLQAMKDGIARNLVRAYEARNK